ncbi:MAG TPA: hypothetical protein VIE36_15385 [Methylomirabilota bacterium]
MTLYFFERITEDDFIGPVIVAAPSEDEAWRLLAARERSERAALEALGWQIAQDLPAVPARASIVYPSHYRRAIVD